jgi:hypothetical protein
MLARNLKFITIDPDQTKELTMPNIGEVFPQTRTSQGGLANAFNLGSASSAQFQITGGFYCLDAIATWGGGSVTVQRVGPDGSTLISTALTLSANGTIEGYLPPGTYQITVATATAVNASLVSIPT